MLAFEFDEGNLKKTYHCRRITRYSRRNDLHALRDIFDYQEKQQKKRAKCSRNVWNLPLKTESFFAMMTNAKRFLKKQKKENDRDFFKEIEQMLQELKRKK